MAVAAMLETKQLKIFKTIVEVGSFTRAGARLNLSQPAISQHIRALEEHLGVPVLLRVGKRARPTPAGEVLLHCAEQVLDKIEDAERLLAEQGMGAGGMVRIGGADAACHHLLPTVLTEFSTLFPRVQLQIASGHTTTTLARVLTGDLDLGLVTLPVDTDRIRVTEVGRDELVAITHPTHAWADRRRVQAADFANEPLILYDRGSRTSEILMRFLLEEGVFPRVTIEADHVAVVKELVRQGVGIAVLPAWAVRREVENGELRAQSVGVHGLTRAWCLAALDNGGQPAALRSLMRLCVEHLPRMLTATTRATS
jgi:LysR family transcriptional regulator, low CO2-responsive transcriptional regulator